MKENLCLRFNSSTVAGYSCSETGTHSANCAADRRVSSGAVLGPFLDMPVIVQRGAQFACRGCRHLRRGADADSYGPSVQKNTEILQLQYIDKVIDIWVCRPCSIRCSREGDSRAPSVAPFSMDTVVALPVVVQRQLPCSRRLKTAQVPQLQHFFMVDVPVVQVHLGVQSWTRSLTCPLLSTTGFYTVEVPQNQFIACLCGHSSCATQTGTTFPACLVMAAMSGFLTHFASFFRAPPVVPELSASFWSPRW